MRTRNCAGMPVMLARCKSCPFGMPPSDSLRRSIEARLMEVSQTCHSTGVVYGKPDTHLCRGARDLQLALFHRIGFLAEPTDAAWAAKAKEVGVR